MKLTTTVLFALFFCTSLLAQTQMPVYHPDSLKGKTPEQVSEMFQRWQRIGDSIRHVAFLGMLDTIPPGTKELSLKSGDFDNIPNKVLALQELKRLDVSRNYLIDLPKGLFKLPKLEVLEVEDNQLQRVKFRKNTTIKVLYIGGNGLLRLPKSLKRLKALEAIYLDRNQLADLRPLRKLKRLKTLQASQNPVRLDEGTFAKGFGQLEHLELGRCSLQSLPSNLGNLKGLLRLLLPENQLKVVPASIGSLSNLETLMLYRNEIDSLPVGVFKLSKMLYFDVYHNKIRSIPAEISAMKELTILYIAHNRLESLPETLGSMKVLERVYLHHNRLSGLPASMANLPNMKFLHLHNNLFAQLPSWIVQQEQLEELTLSANPLGELPDGVLHLANLKIFHAEDLAIEKGTAAYANWQEVLLKLKEKGVNINRPVLKIEEEDEE